MFPLKGEKLEDLRLNAPAYSLNVIILLRQDCLINEKVKKEILKALEGGAQVLVMCHIEQS